MRTALVTGGNRGIGLAICAGLADAGVQVMLAARQLPRGHRAAASLRGSSGTHLHPTAGAARPGDVRAVQLDVASAASIAACVDRLRAQAVHVDILVNNAGVYAQGDLLGTPAEAFREAMEVHFFGPLALCRALVPAMREAGYGRVVNVSSGYGSFGEGLEGPAAYSLSKAALGALTLKLAQESGPAVKVNAVCPGWVRTRMGGPAAELAPAEGADTAVWLALLPEHGPTGGFFRNRQPIPW